MASDSSGNQSSCSFTVQVEDTLPPEVTTRHSPIALWPPNHKYVDFSLKDCVTSAVDVCGGALDVSTAGHITRITSDEAENDGGDGNTTGDMVITGGATAKLRAERAGTGNGRVYRIYFEIGDAARNVTSGSCQVVVPHDQGRGSAVEDGCAYCVGTDCEACRTAGPSSLH